MGNFDFGYAIWDFGVRFPDPHAAIRYEEQLWMSMQLLRFELQIQLKQMPRTGWVQQGVPGAENVAAHSYGVVLTALTLAELVDEPPIWHGCWRWRHCTTCRKR